MAIVSTDIKYKLSGGASNADPNASLGGAMSSTVAGNRFDTVTSAEAAAGSVEYRCIYIHNTNTTTTWIGTKLWIQANTPSGDTDIAIGLGTAGLNGTEQTVANETTAPVGVSFASPSSFASGLTVGDIPPDGKFSFWERRTVTAGAAMTNDTYTLRAQGDTNP